MASYFPHSPGEVIPHVDFDAQWLNTRNHARMCLLVVCTMRNHIFELKFLKTVNSVVVRQFQVS